MIYKLSMRSFLEFRLFNFKNQQFTAPSSLKKLSSLTYMKLACTAHPAAKAFPTHKSNKLTCSGSDSSKMVATMAGASVTGAGSSAMTIAS